MKIMYVFDSSQNKKPNFLMHVSAFCLTNPFKMVPMGKNWPKVRNEGGVNVGNCWLSVCLPGLCALCLGRLTCGGEPLTVAHSLLSTSVHQKEENLRTRGSNDAAPLWAEGLEVPH